MSEALTGPIPRAGKMEIMAPAGSYAALAAAIRSGARSIYFGIGTLNMRSRGASPFTIDDLKRIAKLCRRCGVRSYLTVNTLVYDEELPEMHLICDAAKAAGISAVIATDMATLEYARSINLEIHLSVQCNVSNLAAVRAYARYADVIVLARECTMEQIRGICDGIRTENITGPSGKLLQIEIFAHGALCVAISGKCYMSLATHNSSANRGACLQNCRRQYRVTDLDTGEEFDIENQYIMSPRDLCTIGFLDKLIESGVAILKLEGRARTAHYVSTVTTCYHEALEALEEGYYTAEKIEAWTERMRSVFNRDFWQGGYYCGHPLGEWSGRSHSQASLSRDMLGIVTNYFKKAQVVEFKMQSYDLEEGDTLLFEGTTTGALEVTAKNLRVDGKPATKAEKGDAVTMQTTELIRRNDKVFRLRPADKNVSEM